MSNGFLKTASTGMGSRLCLLLFGASMVAGMSGCNIFRGVNDYVVYNTPAEDFVTGWRDRVFANRAYNTRRPYMDPQTYEADFKKGFIAGYRDIAQGGDGCTPSLPPRVYWSWRYQTAEGQAKVAAWFSGFPHGARAAEEDGVGNYYEIQVANWINDNEDPYCRTCGPDGEPIPPEELYPPAMEEIPGEAIPLDPGMQIPGEIQPMSLQQPISAEHPSLGPSMLPASGGETQLIPFNAPQGTSTPAGGIPINGDSPPGGSDQGESNPLRVVSPGEEATDQSNVSRNTPLPSSGGLQYRQLARTIRVGTR